jgi:RND family efflux transporter MFP subunit
LYGVSGVVVLLAVATGAWALMRDRAVEVRVAVAEGRGGVKGSAGLTADGYVVARTKASVSSKVPGRLAYLGVEEGDRVREGAVIARLEAAEYEAAVRQTASEMLAADATVIEAAAQLTQAERALERAQRLHADSLIAEQRYEDAVTALATARARLRAAEARREAARQANASTQASLDNTIIRAPFSGTVLRKDAEVGEVVAPAVAGGGLTRGAVVTMADLSTLEVEVDINEAYIGSIRDDQPAEIVLDAYPGVTFSGHVRQIVPTADRQKATVLVRVAIDSDDPRILPEMGARVVFQENVTNESAEPLQPRIYVPSGAVRGEGGEDVVWVMVDGHARRRSIDAGPVMGDAREVRSGLSAGETIILDPPAELADGARVKVVQDTTR